ncbi:hypothetical protein Pelo_4077 [Pelomyxa schiedti]|nr:hypothetical protein Pelo_4077 [Pelomyxa schiedti]
MACLGLCLLVRRLASLIIATTFKKIDSHEGRPCTMSGEDSGGTTGLFHSTCTKSLRPLHHIPFCIYSFALVPDVAVIPAEVTSFCLYFPHHHDRSAAKIRTDTNMHPFPFCHHPTQQY